MESAASHAPTVMSDSDTTIYEDQPWFLDKPAHQHHGHHNEHGHDHKHGTDWSDILDGGRNVTRVAILSLSLNMVVMLLKCAAGTYLHSLSLMAEASHAVSDSLSDLLALACMYKARQKPSAKFPLGYGKLEPLGSCLSSLMLLLTSFGIGAQALFQFFEIVFPSYHAWVKHFLSWIPVLHEHHHHHPQDIENEHGKSLYGLALVVFSMLAKEAIYHMMRKTARVAQSSVLEASALHQRMESLGSAMSLVTIMFSSYGYEWLDSLCGIIRALYNGMEAWQLTLTSLGQLCDCSANPEIIKEVQEHLECAVIRAQHLSELPTFTWNDVIVVSHGSGLSMYVTLSLPPHTTLKRALAAEAWVQEYFHTHYTKVRTTNDHKRWW